MIYLDIKFRKEKKIVLFKLRCITRGLYFGNAESFWLFLQIYNHVLMSLWTLNPIYKIYFLQNSDGENRAIVGLKEDKKEHQVRIPHN